MSIPRVPNLMPAERARADENVAVEPPHPLDWEGVAAARTRTLDAGEGFAKMAEHAEPEFAPTVARYYELHLRHAERLTRILEDAGVSKDPDPSLMGTVNRLVVAARAVVDAINDDVLKQIRSGEQYVLDAYDDARDDSLPDEVRQCLSEMRAELQALLDETCPDPA